MRNSKRTQLSSELSIQPFHKFTHKFYFLPIAYTSLSPRSLRSPPLLGIRIRRPPVRRTQSLPLRHLPLTRLPRLDPHQEHRIDLLQRLAARLRQEEEHHQNREEIARREEVAVRETDVAGDEGGGEADEEVEGPV